MSIIRFRFEYVDKLSFKVKLYEIRGWDCPWDCGLATQLVQQHATIHHYDSFTINTNLFETIIRKQSLTPSTKRTEITEMIELSKYNLHARTIKNMLK